MSAKAQSIAIRQALVCREFASHALEACRHGTPVDRATAQILRQRKEQGARDRRLIRQVIFAMFRWRGWIDQWEHEYLSKALLLAYLLDGNPWNLVCSVWAQESNLGILPMEWQTPDDLTAKQQWMSHYTQDDESLFTSEQLFPEFFIRSINIPQNQATVPFVDQLLSCLQVRSPLWIRIQNVDFEKLNQQLQQHHLTTIPHPILPNAVEVQGSINVHQLSLFKAGAFEIQDLASQCIGWVCAPQCEERWWDVCAGGGGKSLQLAALMKGKGQVIATEIRKTKLYEIRRRANRGNWSNIIVHHWDGKEFLGEDTAFDGVLVDAPCSGSGTWRRNPDARWRINLQDVRKLAGLQLEILEGAKNKIKPGGLLVYATCSLMQIENESVVGQFLEQNPNFQLEPFFHPITNELTEGMMTIWPHMLNSDGMFVAKMRYASGII
ncbi:MAG: RsmB/NOP family class I SAM-dependent RNA methyltransferase [SAR324 cluster bacterium]|nr:RsmB/NOP family class I SAM-dependent RNA methyltransferase [SAR324 cluster bacterium]